MSYQQQLNQLAEKGSKRKTDYCPYCGRKEIVSKDAVLVKCSICIMIPTRALLEHKEVTGKDIRSLRKRRKLSPDCVASEIGISTKHLFKIENGKRAITKGSYEWYGKNNAEKDIATY